MLTYVLHSKVFTLFASILLLLIAMPLLTGFHYGREIQDAGYTLIILAALHSVRDRRSVFPAAVVLAVVSTALLWSGQLILGPAARVAGGIGYIALSVLVVAIGLHRLFKARRVDEEVLIGAVTIYLMIGLLFTLWFSLMHTIDPQAFSLQHPAGETLWTEFAYLSFTTLTTLGYGDITPQTPVARLATSLLAVIGVFYQAILVARLVSLYRPPSERNSP